MFYDLEGNFQLKKHRLYSKWSKTLIIKKQTINLGNKWLSKRTETFYGTLKLTIFEANSSSSITTGPVLLASSGRSFADKKHSTPGVSNAFEASTLTIRAWAFVLNTNAKYNSSEINIKMN